MPDRQPFAGEYGLLFELPKFFAHICLSGQYLRFLNRQEAGFAFLHDLANVGQVDRCSSH